MADLVAAARGLADELLAPAAQDTDQAAVVPRSHLEALAEAGLCGLAGPGGYGGRAAPPSVTRPVYEALAGACGVTFFVWVQHHAPVRLLARSQNAELRDRWLAGLCQGSVLGGVAFAYLRRPGPPAVVARTVPGGWTVRGVAPWVTSWGLARLFAVAAVVSPDEPTGGDAGQAMFFLLDADAAGASVRPSPPLAMSAMGASATVRLVFDDLFVPADEVMSTIDLGHWRGRDRAATSQPHPAPFGLATTATRLLVDQARVASGADRPAVEEAARSLVAELDRCRSWAYALSDSDRSGEGHLGELVDARARSLDLAMRSAQALVAATGGRAMGLGHPAQRLVREAAFWSIQAQSAALRTATLGIASGPR
ncbi:MAG TPA: acyl-CoA dehydrogenase family protein [Acidimicrobiales bacterium]|nr:acyl-CoA dehydrogenase family protein [Acidimicrobiales bacterium]